ncbi:hypothetical protein [Desulfosporosinus sp.]|uniref:hypothetical protein n=1 Tax=Desulfosporosinus sp. TaxID=157907 RepID=UPI0025C22C08|nr:hypothetical protein [Desulfosporosinus sp.]MBC2724360.1 hypothetical protein [Desulfosporosinus sp.]MBC2726956.1 hypothetical protein [Desulfosporosinus sp.]
MGKNSKLSNLMRRDEVLRNHVNSAGFVAFVMVMCYGFLDVIFGLVNKEITLEIAKYGLKLVGLGMLTFTFILFMVTKAKTNTLANVLHGSYPLLDQFFMGYTYLPRGLNYGFSFLGGL